MADPGRSSVSRRCRLLASSFGVVMWCVVAAWATLAIADSPLASAVGEVGQLVRRLSETFQEGPEEAIRGGETALELLEITPDPAAEAGVRYDLGRALRTAGRLEEALEQGQRATELAHELGDRRLACRCHQLVGHLHKDRGHFDLALDAMHTALELASAIPDPGLQMTLLINIGNVHSRTGEWDSALGYFEQAMVMATELDDQDRIARTLNNIGIAYRNLDRFAQALEYHHKALEIKERLGKTADIARSLNNIGVIHALRREDDRALEFFLRALELKREVGDRSQVASSLNNIGVAYGNLGQPRLGEEYLSEALQLREELGDQYGLATTLNDLAGLYVANGSPNQAIPIAERSLEVARRIEARQLAMMSLTTLSRAHEMAGNLAEALRCEKLSNDLAEEIFDHRTSRTVAEFEARFEVAEKDREIAFLNREREIHELQLETERVLRWASIVGATVLLALIVALYRAYQLKARTNAELQAAYHHMEDLANRDALTGTLSRRAMIQAVEEEGLRFERFGRPFAVIMADIDRLKEINDRHGHHAGDVVLATLGGILAAHSRGTDAVSRWGGDEFLLLLSETDLHGAAGLAARLRQAVAERPPTIDGRPLHVTLSFGVAVHNRPAPVETTLRTADEAMYAGKTQGGDRITVRD